MPGLTGDYVFREGPKGLEFVGDFEGLYRNHPDPWHQSGLPGPRSSYYLYSRARLLALLRRYIPPQGQVIGLEVGCGHGHLVELLRTVPGVAMWHGLDISPSAISRARKLYPKCCFHVADITQPRVDWSIGFRALPSCEIIVLGQLLWYILHRMDTVMANCHLSLTPGGLLVISQAFLDDQGYGREYVDGFEGARALLQRYGKFQLLESHYDDTSRYEHHDGLFALRSV